MNTDTIIALSNFFQHKILLLPNEQAEEEGISMNQTIYVITGKCIMEYEGKKSEMRCGELLHIKPHTPFKIQNTNFTSLNILLTQVATT